MFYYVYETTNLINGMKYRGKHSAKSINNSYLGSGTILTQEIKKYGRENFVCEILEFFDSDREAFHAEQNKYVTKEGAKRDDTYNLKPGGTGGSAEYVTAKDKAGIVIQVSKDDPRGIFGELVGVTGGMALVKFANNLEGKAFLVDKNDERLKNGILVGHTAGSKGSDERYAECRRKKEVRNKKRAKLKKAKLEEIQYLRKVEQENRQKEGEAQKIINKINYINKIKGAGNPNYKKKWMNKNGIEQYVKVENQNNLLNEGGAYGRCESSLEKQKAGYTSEGRMRMGTLKGSKLSEETKKKIGEKGRGRKHSKESIKKMSLKQSGSGNAAYGRKGIKRDGICMFVKKEEIEKYLLEGGELGYKNVYKVKGVN